ncbi:hypothetical protein C1N91_12740 [Curtobacterium sp. SGAir0471]|uniref:hypothetical protein n=1 Tax=Curtobacterium sp. SGAir0471 TaxID=2070337 RepID=UPI0010CCDFAF|nr:hypothetical protein [Curtobacterium sp. SGAir0471]QCR44260.1 hypothetical protein C1N91_12740 [Curtobacterium sp. SGAir0471]
MAGIDDDSGLQDDTEPNVDLPLNFGEEPAEDLSGDVPYGLQPNWQEAIIRMQTASTPVDDYEAARNKQAEEVANQAGQNTKWRPVLFWTVYGIVLAFATVSVLGIVAYMIYFGKEASPVVLSTWAGGSVAQVVGLMLVITRHLFPQAHDPMIPEK